MNYTNSFEYSLSLSSTEHDADYYSGWFDVGFANQLISNEKAVMANDAGETVISTVERNRPPNADTAILTHSTITADGTTYEEQTGSSVGAGTVIIGSKVRYHVAVTGTWASTTVALTLKLLAKRN